MSFSWEPSVAQLDDKGNYKAATVYWPIAEADRKRALARNCGAQNNIVGEFEATFLVRISFIR
jgi:hypothetical protein